MSSTPWYSCGAGGIDQVACWASSATTPSMSRATNASANRRTRSSVRRVRRGRPRGRADSRGATALQQPFHRDRRRAQDVRDLVDREVEHVAQHDGRPADVREGAAARRRRRGTVLVVAVPARRVAVSPRRRAGLEPGDLTAARRLGHLERWHRNGRSAAPVPERVQAPSRRDAVEPRAGRGPSLELRQTAPRSEQDLLQRVLGVGRGAQDPVAVQAQLAHVRRDERGEVRVLLLSGSGRLGHGRSIRVPSDTRVVSTPASDRTTEVLMTTALDSLARLLRRLDAGRPRRRADPRQPGRRLPRARRTPRGGGAAPLVHGAVRALPAIVGARLRLRGRRASTVLYYDTSSALVAWAPAAERHTVVGGLITEVRIVFDRLPFEQARAAAGA